MFTIEGASLDEVWGQTRTPVKKVRKPRRKEYDDIIDTYLNDFESSCNRVEQETPKVNIVPDQDYYNVSPYFNERNGIDTNKRRDVPVMPVNSSDYGEDALEYNRFFKQDNMFPTKTGDSNTETLEETTQENQVHSEYTQSMHDSNAIYQQPMYYQHAPQSTHSQYLELALYIVSGILLIFILEQILRLGLYLR